MLDLNFIGQSAPVIKRKLQCLDVTLGMNPSQFMDIAFKVYPAQEINKLKHAAIFLERMWENQKEW